MKDQILSGYLQDFQEQRSVVFTDDAQLFAQFAAHCILAKQTGAAVAFELVDVDGGQDTGIDAIAIVVNDRVIEDVEEVDYFKNSGRMEAEFIFIQSKSSPKFDGGEIGNFIFGVRNFFEPSPKVKASPRINQLREVKDYIYKNSIALKKAPVCRLFYVTTGKWVNDDYLSGRISTDLAPLRATNLFSEVTFNPIDGEKIKSYYRELRNRVEKEVLFEKHTILPKISGVEEAYLGLLPFTQFLKLITDEDGALQRSLFYDNVRDFQGGNPVNTEIAETVTGHGTAGSFVLLNNGVTIVAKALKKIGASFHISDYQIVNGCQTSNVLFLNREKLSADVFVPIKLIVTGEPELTNQIIKATNRQTEVKLEAFESLTPFHRSLEEFYNFYGKAAKRRLYYERRSKQYVNTPIEPNSVITLATQAKAFLAMFLNEPHSTHRYYGEILENYGDRLFLEKHSPHPYYAAALALSRVEDLLRTRQLPAGAKRFKYHLILVFRLLIGSAEAAPLAGKKAEEYSHALCEKLADNAKASVVFNEAFALIQRKLGEFNGERGQSDRLRLFTNMLLPPTVERPIAVVTIWHLERGFGFAKTSDGRAVFVHCSAIRDPIHKYLREGESIECDLIHEPKGIRASDVRLVPRKTSK